MWTKFSYLVLIIFSILNNSRLCVGKDFDDVPEVETPLGKVRGAWRTSLGGRKFAAFEGIPYAKPPVGDLRFEDPQPVEPWSETLVATTTHVCPQIKSFMFKKREGDEDCLYLNVYYPHNAGNFDVLVLIHGGAFMVGNAHMVDASMLMDKDLVLVTLNYRLGIFGFLSTEDDAIRGNFGLKDQALALQWVKDNIASFNGKPESVTLAGLSSGGISVHLHYFSPLSKGLFARGLSQSGTALSPLAIRNNPLQSAKKLGALLNCLEGSTNDLKTCLKEVPAESIYKQLKEFYLQGKLPLSPFGPVVEKGGEPFLDAKPYDLLTQGKVLDAPWITSNVADDGLVPASFYWSELDQLKKNLTQILPLMLESNDTMPVQGRKKLLRSILDFYLGEGKKIKEKSFMNFTKILTDKLYVLPAETAAKLQSKVTKSPVYYYHFNYREGEVKAIRSYVRSQKLQGVVHGEDGLYFYAHFPEYSQQDEELRNACQNMLYAYMSTGKPTFEGVTWEPTGSTELTYLNITGPGDIKLQRSQSLTPIEFWRSTGLLDFEPFVVKDEL